MEQQAKDSVWWKRLAIPKKDKGRLAAKGSAKVLIIHWLMSRSSHLYVVVRRRAMGSHESTVFSVVVARAGSDAIHIDNNGNWHDNNNN